MTLTPSVPENAESPVGEHILRQIPELDRLLRLTPDDTASADGTEESEDASGAATVAATTAVQLTVAAGSLKALLDGGSLEPHTAVSA